jgi:hypothetical protein
MNEQKAHQQYDKILRIVTTLMGSGSTFSNDLEELGRKILGHSFAGVSPADRIPTLNNNKKYAIVNLDFSGEIGSHWVACAYNNGSVMMYDSFGRKADRILPALTAYRVIDTDDDKEQLQTEENCGQRSLAWLIFHAMNGAKNAKLI